MKNLNSCFTTPLTTGIFTTLNTKTVPWSTNATSLNMIYHGNHSGKKPISPLVEALLNTDGKLEATDISSICDALVAMYGVNWTKLYATLSLTYNPLNNYDMVETEEIEGETEDTHTGTDTLTKTGTDTTDTTQTVDNDATTNNSAFGFNSGTAVPTDSHTGTTDSETTGQETETLNLTDTQTKNLTDSGTHSTSRTLTRSGNIGVTSSMELIASERDLWLWRFFEQVFNDLDEVLTINYYKED